MLRRPPVIWDNLHANDYDQKRIFLGESTIVLIANVFGDDNWVEIWRESSHTTTKLSGSSTIQKKFALDALRANKDKLHYIRFTPKLSSSRLSTSQGWAEVPIMACNPTFHHLCYNFMFIPKSIDEKLAYHLHLLNNKRCNFISLFIFANRLQGFAFTRLSRSWC